jgi:tRNA (cmo5U34)-methyltransferase
VTQWHWDPDSYLDNMLAEVPAYPELQEQAALATQGIEAKEILELGIGTGETARRVLRGRRDARLTAIDSSPEMLDRARERIPGATLAVARLEDPLPKGPFDLVVSALAVHHLDGAGKRDLFRRVFEVTRAGGFFVLADVIVPERLEDVVTPIDGVYDLPDRLDDQLEWLAAAGFEADPLWVDRDLAVVRAIRPPRPG